MIDRSLSGVARGDERGTSWTFFDLRRFVFVSDRPFRPPLRGFLFFCIFCKHE